MAKNDYTHAVHHNIHCMLDKLAVTITFVHVVISKLYSTLYQIKGRIRTFYF